MTASTNATAASSSCRRRSVSIATQPIVRGKLEQQREWFVGFALRELEVVEDDEFRSALELVEELPEAFVIALQPHVDFQPAEPFVLLRRFRFVAALLVLHVGLSGELGQR